MARTTKQTDDTTNEETNMNEPTDTSPVENEVMEAAPSEGSTPKVEETITAYRFAKVANAALEEAGHKQLPPQMFYSYAKKGMLGTPEKPLTEAYATVWVEAYLNRKATKQQATAAATE